MEIAAILNGWAPDPTLPVVPVTGSGGHTDWRLPTFAELTSIKNPTQPGCTIAATGACIDPIFGPTIPGGYWTTTTFSQWKSWWVHFGDPTLIGLSDREVLLGVRPVRDAF